MSVSNARAFTPNYDEKKVPDYTLPDPLLMEDGSEVKDEEAWMEARRGEILERFKEHVYGRAPGNEVAVAFHVVSEDDGALDGKATRREVRAVFRTDRGERSMDILLFLPNGLDEPAPVFLGLNFFGNHTIHPDPGISIPETWMRPNESMGVVDNRATEAGRGVRANRWPVELILSRGYGLAAIYCGDLVPDHAEGLDEGVPALFRDAGEERAPDEWGAIGAWAWGLSRAVDYFETASDVDAERVAVLGHSRLGKTALWAGATDSRFAVTISNNSGCGGAALSRRRFGETVERINTNFPHWFCLNFRQYNENEDSLPVDQHMLVALVAPRPVYIASATEDRWADPRGEFLSAKHAGPVYSLFGLQGLETDEMPLPDRPVGDTIGYHLREGGHDLTEYDWRHYLDFADRVFEPTQGDLPR